MFTGDESQSNAWFARARTVLEEYGHDGPERGYPLVIDGIRQMFAGDPAAAVTLLSEAQAIGKRFNDATLGAMAGHGLGRALVALGRTAEGMAALDEVMVAVVGGEVSPVAAGDLYCGVIEACHEVFDIRRAGEWTSALTRWCESQPDLVPYRGPCLVHRVELLRLQGDWQHAFEEARRACEWLSAPVSPEGPGDAHYQIAELHRLRGEFAQAEEAYRQASRAGRQPEPGLALLWLARGQGEAARTAVHRALEEAGDNRSRRAELLGAYVEILLALGDTAAAGGAASELAGIASAFEALLLTASSDRATGRILIAEGSPASALAPLRRAWTAWQRLEAPYEAARERVQIGIAYQELGDHESAAMEFDAARWVFQELGATPELARLDALDPAISAAESSSGLTAREIEVLRLIAAGRTNKEIASMLVISEHTVARHVQNMLAKLSFSSRTRLATFAIEQAIVPAAHRQL
jgi:DNA-binding CsgD family transcriptional regulator